MYEIERRGGGSGGSKNRFLGNYHGTQMHICMQQ